MLHIARDKVMKFDNIDKSEDEYHHIDAKQLTTMCICPPGLYSSIA